MSAKFGVLTRGFATSTAAQQLVKPPVQVFGLEGRYASALYSAAHKKKALAAVDKDLKDFSALMKSDKILREFVLNPLISKTLKKEGIESVLTKKKANALTTNLLGALAENGRLQNVEGVVNAFGIIMAAEKGEIVCEITTAKELDAAGKKELEASLKAFAQKGQSLQIKTKVDPSIIGGMIVVIGDRYVDMSIASKVKKYTDLIQSAV